MVKPLLFKGEKKPKKRKRAVAKGLDGHSPTPKQTPEAIENDDTWVSADAATDVAYVKV
jgi:protein FRG1